MLYETLHFIWYGFVLLLIIHHSYQLWCGPYDVVKSWDDWLPVKGKVSLPTFIEERAKGRMKLINGKVYRLGERHMQRNGLTRDG